MTIPSATKNGWLDGVAVTHASLHDPFPGSTGTGELSGGAYVRKAITLSAAAGGSRVMAAPVTFDVPISTVRWVGFWNSAVFVFAVPNGGATPKNFMAVPSTDLVWSTGHGYADTQKVVFYNGTPPAPLVEGTVYFVRDSLTDSFKVAATSGGTALDLTAGSSFGCVVAAIVEDVYAIAGTHQLTAATETVPD